MTSHPPIKDYMQSIYTLTTSVTTANKRIWFSTDTQLIRKPATYGRGRGRELPVSYELMHETYQTNGFAPPTSRYIRYRGTTPPFGCWGKCSVIYRTITIWPWRTIWISSNERGGRNTNIMDSGIVENIWTLLTTKMSSHHVIANSQRSVRQTPTPKIERQWNAHITHLTNSKGMNRPATNTSHHTYTY